MNSYEKPGWPAGLRNLGNREENFPICIRILQPGRMTGTKLLLTNCFAQLRNKFGLVCISTSEVCELTFFIRARIQQSQDFRERYNVLWRGFFSVTFIPVDSNVASYRLYRFTSLHIACKRLVIIITHCSTTPVAHPPVGTSFCLDFAYR